MPYSRFESYTRHAPPAALKQKNSSRTSRDKHNLQRNLNSYYSKIAPLLQLNRERILCNDEICKPSTFPSISSPSIETRRVFALLACTLLCGSGKRRSCLFPYSSADSPRPQVSPEGNVFNVVSQKGGMAFVGISFLPNRLRVSVAILQL